MNTPGCLASLRCAFFTSVNGFGGSEIIFADVIEGAWKAGAEVICWSPSGVPLRAILAERGVEVAFRDWPIEEASAAPPKGSTPTQNTIPAQPRRGVRSWKQAIPLSFRKLAGLFQEARHFRRELEFANPDLLLINCDGFEASAFAAGRWNRARTLGLYNLSVSPFPGGLLARWIDRLMKIATMHSFSRAIHASAAARQEWNRLTYYPESRSTVIHNGVAIPPEAPAAARVDLGIAEDDFVFCVAARLHPIKGHRYLIDAVKLSPNDFAKCKVLFCGDGFEQQALAEQCSSPPISNVIKMLGFRKDVLDVIRLSDCLLLSSIESENLSLAALEAMMLGKPVISTRVGGMAEAVIHEETGLLVPPKSPAALRDGMVRMSANRGWARELGARGRQLALQQFTREEMVAKYVAELAKTAGR